MNDQNRELNESIKLFFWDPRDRRDFYGESYKKVNEGLFKKERGIRYPRLLFLREDLYFTLWKPLDPSIMNPTHAYDGLPHFASILVMRSAIEMLVSSLFAKNYDKPCATEFGNFFNNYLNIGKNYSDVLYYLRNSLVHDGYSLSSYKGDLKYYFSMTSGGSVAIKETKRQRSYPTKEFEINPWVLHESFESGLNKLQNDLLNENDIILRGRYKQYLSDRDTWILVI